MRIGKYELLARCLVTFVAFFPFFAFKELERVLGEGKIRTCFSGTSRDEVTRSGPSNTAGRDLFTYPGELRTCRRASASFTELLLVFGHLPHFKKIRLRRIRPTSLFGFEQPAVGDGKVP